MRTSVLLLFLVPLAACGGPDTTPADASRDAAHAPGTDAGAHDAAALDAHTTPSTGPWANVTANLAGMASECGSVSGFAAKPDEDLLVVGVALHGLWASTDGGGSWHALGTGAGSDAITNRTTSFVFDAAHASVFWEAGIYNGPGVYRTDDDGLTFHALGDAHHDDAVSVDFTDASRTVLLAGGHEQAQTLYRSNDGGAHWTNVGTNLPAGTNFSSAPLVLDAMTHLVGCSGWGSGTSGIYRTTDGGMHWAQVSDASASGQPLVASDGTIYWSVMGGGVARSTDSGQHWDRVGDGGVHGTPIELPDGRIAALGSSAIVVSSDSGAHWQPATESLPYGDSVGVAYSRQQRAFFVWHFDCGMAVLDDAIMRHDFDWETH